LSLSSVAGCAGSSANVNRPEAAVAIGPERMLDHSDAPVLFLGPEPDAPAIGYGSRDLAVRILASEQNGRVAVETAGPIVLSAHVPSELLTLRAQRRGRLRGSPVYVGPNDRVRLLGRAPEADRVRLSATPVIAGVGSTPFEGTYPAVGVSGLPAPGYAEPPEPGVPHELPAGTRLVLRAAPSGPVVAELGAQPLPVPVSVVRSEGGFKAVRVGEGPYLVGYTDARLVPASVPAAQASTETQEDDTLPARLRREPGALLRVRRGAELIFNERVIGRVREDGWARLIRRYPEGVSVDDTLAVRALVKSTFLTPARAPEPVSETPSTP
jgi:hypothetical protein